MNATTMRDAKNSGVNDDGITENKGLQVTEDEERTQQGYSSREDTGIAITLQRRHQQKETTDGDNKQLPPKYPLELKDIEKSSIIRPSSSTTTTKTSSNKRKMHQDTLVKIASNNNMAVFDDGGDDNAADECSTIYYTAKRKIDDERHANDKKKNINADENNYDMSNDNTNDQMTKREEDAISISYHASSQNNDTTLLNVCIGKNNSEEECFYLCPIIELLAEYGFVVLKMESSASVMMDNETNDEGVKYVFTILPRRRSSLGSKQHNEALQIDNKDSADRVLLDSLVDTILTTCQNPHNMACFFETNSKIREETYIYQKNSSEYFQRSNCSGGKMRAISAEQQQNEQRDVDLYSDALITTEGCSLFTVAKMDKVSLERAPREYLSGTNSENYRRDYAESRQKYPLTQGVHQQESKSTKVSSQPYYRSWNRKENDYSKGFRPVAYKTKGSPIGECPSWTTTTTLTRATNLHTNDLNNNTRNDEIRRFFSDQESLPTITAYRVEENYDDIEEQSCRITPPLLTFGILPGANITSNNYVCATPVVEDPAKEIQRRFLPLVFIMFTITAGLAIVLYYRLTIIKN